MPKRWRRCAVSRGCATGWRAGAQFFVTQSSSSLTRRIVFLNVTGLLALSIGIIFLSQFRAGLIDARIQSLHGAGRDHRRRDRGVGDGRNRFSITHRSRQAARSAAGRKLRPDEDALYGIDFPINPERVAPVLRRLVSPTKTRARIYDRDGVLLLDSRNLFGRGDVLRFDLPPPTAEKPGLVRARLHRGPDAGSAAATCRSIANSAPKTARAMRKSPRR